MTALAWQHGTIYGYEVCNGGGRNACADCREARREHGAEWRRRKAYGTASPTDRLDPTRALQALHLLTAMGHNTMGVQQLSGVPNQHISRLLRTEPKWISRDCHERILSALHYALQHPTWEHSPLVPSARTIQQVRSLCALGWPLAYLLSELGLARTGMPWHGPTVKRSTARKVQALYDRLGATHGPSRVAAAHARSLGWHVPLAYEDDGTLASGAIPDPLSEARARRESRLERVAAVEELTASGLSARQIAAALGCTSRTVVRDRGRRSA